jgi:hypothetical protein
MVRQQFETEMAFGPRSEHGGIDTINRLNRIIDYGLEPIGCTIARMNSNTQPSTTSTEVATDATAPRKPESTDRTGASTQPEGERFEDSDSLPNKPVICRKVLLRVVFWALGLAAAFGAAGVIFAGHDTLWRIVGTCAATAAGAFLMLAASRHLDRETTRLPGVMLVSLIVTEYLASLGQIWNLFRSAEEPVAFTMFFLAATTIPAVGFCAILKRPDAALSARVGLFATCVVFVLLMVGTWGGWGGDVRAERGRPLGLSLAVFAGLAVLCLIGTGTDRRHWRWLGVVAAGVAFSISAYAILLNLAESSAAFICVVSVAAVVAHANAMTRCPLKPAQRWLLWGTIGAGVATGGFVDLAKLTSPWQEEILGRLAGATAIIGGCGTLALLVLARVNQRIVPLIAAAADMREVGLTCPRCRTRQTIAIGSGACRSCGLVIDVRVQEPKS